MADPKPAEPAMKRPTGLHTRGRRFWDTVTDDYDLGIDEMQLLVEVCRELDNAEALAALLRRDGLTVTGSTGQVRVHPASSELRASRLAIGKLLSQLGLPGDDGQPGVVAPLMARGQKGANARWGAERAREQQQTERRRG